MGGVWGQGGWGGVGWGGGGFTTPAASPTSPRPRTFTAVAMSFSIALLSIAISTFSTAFLTISSVSSILCTVILNAGAAGGRGREGGEVR